MKYWLLILSLFFTACARQLIVSTNTFADQTAIPYGFRHASSFSIAPEQNQGEMLTKEIGYKIGKLLTESGYQIASQPDYIFRFDFQTSSETKMVSVPHFIEGPSETTTGSIKDKGNTIQYEEKTQSSGTLVYTDQEVTLFNNALSLRVFDRHGEKVWEGFATNTSSSSDSRESLDYLLVSAMQHFGLNTHKKLSSRITEKHPSIRFLRQR